MLANWPRSYLLILAGFCLEAAAYEVELLDKITITVKKADKPTLDAPVEGESLLNWVGEAAEIEKIVLGKPFINQNHGTLTDSSVRQRLGRAVNKWKDGKVSLAPFTQGVIVFKGDRKLPISWFLGGVIAVEGHLFGVDCTNSEQP